MKKNIILEYKNDSFITNAEALGIRTENLQGKLIFKPEPFVDGACRMYIEGRGSILMQKEEDCYTIDILSSLLTEECLDVCFKITEPENEKGIPIFCSKKIYFKVYDTIDTEGEIPEDYPSWEQVLDSKIAEINELEEDIEEAVTGVENLNIDVSDKVDGDVTVTLTKKDGTTKEVIISDGEQGPQGVPGPQGEPGAIRFIIVQSLPVSDIDTNAIYLVPITPDESDNNYAEYIYVNNQWELLGKIGVHADLSGYQPLIDITHKLASDLVDDTTSVNKFTNATEKATWNSKLDASALADYVTNTDYATSSVGGVIKVGSSKGTGISNGTLTAVVVTYENYSNLNGNGFISKGTLDNVLNAVVGDIASTLDSISGEVV